MERFWTSGSPKSLCCKLLPGLRPFLWIGPIQIMDLWSKSQDVCGKVAGRIQIVIEKPQNLPDIHGSAIIPNISIPWHRWWCLAAPRLPVALQNLRKSVGHCCLHAFGVVESNGRRSCAEILEWNSLGCGEWNSWWLVALESKNWCRLLTGRFCFPISRKVIDEGLPDEMGYSNFTVLRTAVSAASKSVGEESMPLRSSCCVAYARKSPWKASQTAACHGHGRHQRSARSLDSWNIKKLRLVWVMRSKWCNQMSSASNSKWFKSIGLSIWYLGVSNLRAESSDHGSQRFNENELKDCLDVGLQVRVLAS